MTRGGRATLLLAGISLLGYAGYRYGGALRGTGGPGPPAPGSPAPEARAAPGKDTAVQIRVVYGTEKERWLKAAVEEFARARPDIGVDLHGLGTIEAVRAIAEGREKPTVWSPADEIAVNLLDAEWLLQKGTSLVEHEGDLGPQPLVVTPLVMIAWEERARLIAAKGVDPTDWRTVHDLAVNPRGWLGLGGPADWGYVKLGHTAPSSSNSGLQALVLMTYAFHNKRTGLKTEDVLVPAFHKWLKEIETAVGKFGASSGTYMKDMVLYGPSKYDLIWNYESVAIGDMAAAQGRWGNLAVYYPKPTLWSNHPFVLLKGDWTTREQRAAALALRAFLLTPAIQARALEFGFRPANPEVKLLTTDPQNPWNRLKPFGIRVEVPAVAEPPSGEVTRLLLETWRRVVEAQR